MAMSGGGLRLFTFRGIPVLVHWSWAVIALIEIQWRSGSYSSIAWNVVEYLSLFAIVLLHEFGHALACRSTGGRADRILLWPLGGVAFVDPPQRPGAQLWSIAAGPLVNVVLLPVTIGAYLLVESMAPGSDLSQLARNIGFINFGLLVFNLLPIYPLDGGQILRSMLWFGIGKERSLLVAASIGIVASVLGGLAAFVYLDSVWTALIAAYAAWRSWAAVKLARAQMELARMPKQPLARCPSCGEAPPLGAFWRCPNEHLFDPFLAEGACNQCESGIAALPCVHYGQVHPVAAFLPGRRVVIEGVEEPATAG